MISDLSFDDYTTLNTEDQFANTPVNRTMASQGSGIAPMWSGAGNDLNNTPGITVNTGTGARPKTVPNSSRIKNSELAAQVAKLSQEIDLKMKILESKITDSKQPQPQQEAARELAVQSPSALSLPVPKTNRTQPQDNSVNSLNDLYQLPGLMQRVEADLNELPLGGQSKDRETFYRQLVQDTVKEASGKLKIKSGLDLDSQELVRRIIYWPHAFTSELSHCTKTRKATNIDLEAFIFGFVNILLLPDGDVSQQEKQCRLILLKHLMSLAILRGWPQARQLHNCVLQGIETGAVSWSTSWSHLSQLATTAGNSGIDLDTKDDKSRKTEKDQDKVLNIICRSFNADNTQGAECAYSKEGRTCNKVHVCMSCAKQGLCFRHPERKCTRRK